MTAGAMIAPPLATPSVRRKARRLRNGRWWGMAAPPGLAVISEIRALSMAPSREPRDLRAGQASPEGRQARERGGRQRALVDAGGGVLQLLETRVAEQDGRDLVGGQGEAQRRLDETTGVALVDQRAQHACVPCVRRVIGGRADGIDGGSRDRVARLGSAQRARGQHANHDHAHALLLTALEEPAEVLRRETWRKRVA